jgi:hypothetical protein
MLENNIYVLERQMAAEVTTRRAAAQRMHLAAPGRVSGGGTIRSLLVLALALVCALAVLALSTGPAQASGLAGLPAAGAYQEDDYYILVHVCAGQSCARPADWASAERQLQALFRAGDWGQDAVVVSRSNPNTTRWAQWAAEHLYYVDETNDSARRNAIRVLHQELGSAAVLHIVAVPSEQ